MLNCIVLAHTYCIAYSFQKLRAAFNNLIFKSCVFLLKDARNFRNFIVLRVAQLTENAPNIGYFFKILHATLEK